MATFTSAQAASTYPTPGFSGGSAENVSWGTIAVAANPVAADIYQMCKIPGGSTIIGGYVMGSDLDTGTETLDMNVGWAANGTEALDADGLGNLGLWSGDAATNIKPEAGIYFPFAGVLYTAAPPTFTNETIIQLTCVTTAATFTAGQITVVVKYVQTLSQAT